MRQKIVRWRERFWQEIVFVLIYFLYTTMIHFAGSTKASFFSKKQTFLHILPSKLCKLIFFALFDVY